MREILFRAKSLLKNEWVYGLPVCSGFSDRDITSMCLKSIPDGWPSSVKINLETIGQYTGLNDRNGKKIFEGDIIQCGENGYKAIVKYGEYIDVNLESFHYGFYLEWEREYCYRKNDIGYWTRQGSEVIGNIFDMSDLIGGTTQ